MNKELTTRLSSILSGSKYPDAVEQLIEDINNDLFHFYRVREQARNSKKASTVVTELKQLEKRLNGLSSDAKLHLRRHGANTSALRDALTTPYTLDNVRTWGWKFIARDAKVMLEHYGIQCTSQKNGPYVQYLDVIKELTGAQYSSYNVARKFIDGKNS